MTNYSMPVVMGQLAAGNQALSQLDTDYDSVARMGTYMCSSTGTNAYTLTGLTGYPTMTAYGNNQKIGFIANATSTTLVTIAVSPLGTLKAYQNNGSTQITTGGIVAGSYYEFAYNSTLNSSAGGWQKVGVSTTGAITNVSIQSFVANGTYTPTTGMLYCIGFVQGGGGGGGGTLGDAGEAGGGAGGGAGTTCQFFATAAQIGVSQTVTVGGGGAGGAAGQNTGATGSTSALGALVSCPGGFGGTGGTSETVPTIIPGQGTGVAATVATVTSLLNKAGESGDYALILNGTTVISGKGGNSLFGSGGAGISANNLDGFAGGVGSGGSGGVTLNSNTDRAGGAGGAGVVVITEYSAQ